MKHSAIYSLLIVAALSIVACNNSSQSITKENQKTFTEFFHMDLPSDVKNFHYFPDAMGIDASYWISFDCDEGTVALIKEKLELVEQKKPDDGLIGGLNIEPETWWDTAFIRKTKPFSHQKENAYRYLWYDKAKKKVYFLSFDT